MKTEKYTFPLADRAARSLDRRALELVRRRPEMSLLDARGDVVASLLRRPAAVAPRKGSR